MSKWNITLVVLAIFILLTVGLAHAQPPETVIIQGQLLDSGGAPIPGLRQYSVKFFDAESNGNQLGATTQDFVNITTEGLFAFPVLIPQAALGSADVWYELAVDSTPIPNGVDANDTFPNRIKVHSVPFARVAGEAMHMEVENIGDGSISTNEFSMLYGLTGNIQYQLGNKANTSDVYTQTDVDTSQAIQDADIAGKLPKTGPAYVIVDVTNDAVQNGANLLSAYAQAAALTPHGQALSPTNRAVVLVPPGNYDLSAAQLVLDTDYVDLVGLSTAREDQYLFATSDATSRGTVRQTASNVRMENLYLYYTKPSCCLTYTSTSSAAYFPDSDLSGTVLRNCTFGNNDYAWSMRTGITYSGVYEDCTGGYYAFGGNYGTAGGTFINCTGGIYAFGGNGTASGNFINCTGLNYAFGSYYGTASGNFINCTGGNYAFGGEYGTASGNFSNCTGGNYAFGGYYSTASGTFRNCTGGSDAFGGNYSITNLAKLKDCSMTGSWTSSFSGRMENCRWEAGISLDANARIYRSTFKGTVNLNYSAAGIAHSAMQGLTNAGSAAFNSDNLVDADVN